MPVTINNGPTTPTTQENTPTNMTPGVAPIEAQASPITNSTLNGHVVIQDTQAPLIILYGPTSCGKTMTLVRLSRFLRSQKYQIVPDLTFRDASDQGYQTACENFVEMLSSEAPAQGTSASDYMLVDVISEGRTLCKILEAPGEYYFDPNDPQKQYPGYMHKIIATLNRKVWCLFVEPNWQPATKNNLSSDKIREKYTDRIRHLTTLTAPADRFVVVFNKIDKTGLVKKKGVVNVAEAIKKVEQSYPGIFEIFENRTPIVKWFRKYDCSFVPFQTGVYTTDPDPNTGIMTTSYTEGSPEFVRELWNEIKRSI